ncbi:MAG: WecB/TagA/CpsF family glycosyltransferase [Ardenticatenaceae bacterium]
MIDQGKKNVLGVWIDAVDYAATVERVMAAARARQALAVSALAVHGVMTGVLDATQRYRLNQLDLVVPDGQPVRWALNLLHHTALTERVYGPALMTQLCERAAQEGLPIYLYGSRASVLTALAANLRAQLPGLTIAGARPSRFKRLSAAEKQELIAEIAQSGAALTFVGLGCPRQETWLYEYRAALSMPVIAVGAAFDFHAGALPQAPVYLQRAGLEWLFRLLHEPRRLWQRYLLLNPLYLALLLVQASRLKRFEPSDATPPVGEMRYG